MANNKRGRVMGRTRDFGFFPCPICNKPPYVNIYGVNSAEAYCCGYGIHKHDKVSVTVDYAQPSKLIRTLAGKWNQMHYEEARFIYNQNGNPFVNEEEKIKMDNRMQVQGIIENLKGQMVGHKYRHFKGGIYEVIDLAVHSESEEPMIIYRNAENPNLVWCRPLDMFLSEVDHTKYPEVKQMLRFEKIDK